MNKNTRQDISNLVIYQVYVRNHTQQGTFAALEEDLPRIRSMGVDMLHFLPIHPIGQLNKKGSLGCPYSIADYRGINPEYGNLQDFQHFLAFAHSLGLKVMIDVVFNHTAHDSVLVREHPDWFHQDADGKPVTTVPEWSDVIDLKYPNLELENYLVETLVYWADTGVDGFRCDVASLIPLDFWKAARAAVDAVKPGVIWLAESVHPSFILSRRANELRVHTDSELFEAFDICYDYDIWSIFLKAVDGEIPVIQYLDMLRFQEAIYPLNAYKLRFVENHDQRRFMFVVPDSSRALAWTALQVFNKGPFLIYAGQESGVKKRPSLFHIDKVKWDDYIYQQFISRLVVMKKHQAIRVGRLFFTTGTPAVVGYWINGEKSLAGVFNVAGVKGRIAIQVSDGEYKDHITGNPVTVRGGFLDIPDCACIFECSIHKEPSLEYSSWIT